MAHLNTAGVRAAVRRARSLDESARIAGDLALLELANRAGAYVAAYESCDVAGMRLAIGPLVRCVTERTVVITPAQMEAVMGQVGRQWQDPGAPAEIALPAADTAPPVDVETDERDGVDTSDPPPAPEATLAPIADSIHDRFDPSDDSDGVPVPVPHRRQAGDP